MIEYLLGSDDENEYKVAYKLALVAFGIMAVLNVMLLAKLSRWL
jgi:hypothetical protein